jgi:hypothetical protein
VLAKARICPMQSSAELEHECCVHNNIRCKLEAFFVYVEEIIYKVYGKYMIKSPLKKDIIAQTMKKQFLSHLQQVCFYDYCKVQSMVHHH